MKSVSVFCGSSEGNDSHIVSMAYELGKNLAQQNLTLVYGGAKVGLMGQVANGALDHDGKVIGVIPDFLKSKEIFHEGITELIIVDNMHERKMKMHELSDGIIALPGGFGTLEELFEVVTWSQLGLHQQPMGILNVNGFFDELLAFLDTMVSKGLLRPENRNMLLVDDSCTGLLEQMKSYRPVHIPKWIKKEQT
ncbi:TIGR00730 family Rossman fold protein [Flagellimonas sediminis]|uniref:Cytokinin riboside 5'-monophosphate phosphoribohydrolase n=1 Tax=Flagellimonas sediminis TaxID=2696468 RepID=A0A6I5KTS1_9FLAO|nr:TIGR00730 family Rossman fold protein [Allomuricauda sediminis]NDV44037.1 TIGR00730 family Rossman fold protein [Allomuricauda sediminis]